MYIEKRYIRKITKVFESLSIPLRLVDASGQCIVPEGGNDFALPETILSPSINHHVGRSLCRGLDMNPPVYLITEASGTSVEGLQREGGIGPMASLWSEEIFLVSVKIQLGK